MTKFDAIEDIFIISISVYALAVLLFITSCGSIDVEGEVDFIESKVKKVQGKVYIGLFAGDRLLGCIPSDAEIPKEWTFVEDIDHEITEVEEAFCLQK